MESRDHIESETADSTANGSSSSGHTNSNNQIINQNAMQVVSSESPPAQSQIILRDPNTRPVYKLSVRLIDTYKYINKVPIFLIFVLFLLTRASGLLRGEG